MSKKTELDFSHADCCRRIFETVRRQQDLADMLGVTPSAISESKRRQRCSLELIIAASEITGRPIEWFMFGERGENGSAAPGAKMSPGQLRIEFFELVVRQLEQRFDRLEDACCSE